MQETNEVVSILVIEDSPTQAEHLKYLLETTGHAVTVASTGKEALYLLRTHKPTLIISDIIMPEMDGYQLCKLIKTDEHLKDIPVILLTALSEPEDVLRGLECNADNFITKPYDEKYLLSRIHYILINRELRKNERVQLGVEVFFSGQKFLITSERQQILDLLLSTYEIAVQQNSELTKIRDELKALNEQLELKVEERTKLLQVEIEERRRAELDVRRSNRTLKMLSGCNEALVRAERESDLLRDICQIITEVGGYRLAWVGFAEHDEEKTVRTIAQSGFDKGYLDKAKIAWADTERGRGPTGKAIRTGKHSIAGNIHTDPDFLPWRDEALEHGYSSTIAFPLITDGQNGEVFGALAIYASAPDAFQEGEVTILSELASDLSYGIRTLRTREERTRAERRIQKEIDFNKTLIQTSPAFFVAIRPDGKLLLMNESMLHALGYTDDEVLGKDYIANFVPESDRTVVSDTFSKLIDMKESATLENHISTKDGKELVVEWRGRPILNEQGNLDYFFGVGIDITERKRAEEDLRFSEERYRSVVEYIGIGISLISPNMEILALNKQMKAWFTSIDVSTRPICYKAFNDPPREEICSYCPTCKTLQDGQVHEAMTETPAEDKIIFFRVISSPVKDQSGQIIAAVEMVEDITERIQSEEALRKEKTFSDTTINSLPGIFYLFDENGHFLRWNKNFEIVSGYSCEEIEEMGPLDFFSGEEKELVGEAIQEVFLEGESRAEADFISKDGRRTPYYLTGLRFLWDTKLYLVGMGIDITERRRAEAALHTSEAQLSNALRIAHLGHWEYDVVNDLFTFNDHFYSIFRTTAEEVGGYVMSSSDYAQRFVHPDDISVISAEIQKAVESNDPLYSRQLDHRIIYADGETGYITVRFFIIKNAQGKTLKTYGVNQDITERKKIEDSLRQSEAELREAQRVANVGSWELDLKTGTVTWSEEIYRIFGRDPALPAPTFTEHSQILTSSSKSQLESTIETTVRTGQPFEVDLELIRPDAITGWITARGEMKRKDAYSTTLRGTVLNITERKRAEEALRKSEDRFKQVAENTGEWIWEVDASGLFTYSSPTVEKILGYKPEEITGKKHFYDFFSPEDREELQTAAFAAFAQKKAFRDFISRNLCRNGKEVWISTNGSPVFDRNGNVIGYRGSKTDITERKRLEERLQYLAYYDDLTGLPNRNLFADRLTQGIARADFSGRPVAVLSFGVDRFKFVNDTYGFDAGDAVLKEVGARLTASVREGDTIARLGNDDYGVLLIDLAQTEDIVLIIEKIMKNVSQPIYFKEKEIMTTLSAGVTVYPVDGIEAAGLLKNADLALAKAKQRGRKNYLFYTEDLNVKATEFVLMEKNLVRASKNEEFILHYQPYWDITTKKIVGMEALVRWQSKDEGLVSPGKFIPVLEDTGMIIEVGEWILRTAVRQVKEWQNNGYPVVPVSVNLSLIQFRQKDLAEMVKKVLGEAGFHTSLLTLEITESAFMQDIEFTSSVLTNLRDIGISISIDDFGTGYSSLSYLKRFPVDNLKIDISFIREIATDPDAASIVMAVISMAHTLGIKTIAEGIETEEQWNILRLLRCDMGQGFYLSRPMPAKDIERLFKQQ